MARRSLLSRLLSLRNPAHPSAADHQSRRWQWVFGVVRFFMVISLILSAIWLLLAIWYQFGATSAIAWLVTPLVIGWLTTLVLLIYLPKKLTDINNSTFNRFIQHKQASKWLIGIYCGAWAASVGWFFSIAPSQNLNWQPEVSQVLSYTRDANNPDLITFQNVRNFDWYIVDDINNNEEIAATERWETRTVDMSKLSGIDISNSYWMGPLIAHTLVSFRFEDDRPLTFSFEIRKEADESFSALAGFFRRFELSLIASEERDIIYTRTNARGEQVYLFPISHLRQQEVRALFESYLLATDELNTEPAWYNTLTDNCTNIIFYMARLVSGERLPWDYRIWVSGWLPNYLFDIGMLDASPEMSGQPWTMDTWYERTHINPKVIDFDNQVDSNADNHDNSIDFSKQIRQGLVIPPLDDSKLEAERGAESAAIVSNE